MYFRDVSVAFAAIGGMNDGAVLLDIQVKAWECKKQTSPGINDGTVHLDIQVKVWEYKNRTDLRYKWHCVWDFGCFSDYKSDSALMPFVPSLKIFIAINLF